MSNDLVSIITPTWNCGRFIVETIESVLAQTYSNWEMIIQDDCSTDDTEQIVSEYMQKDSRIKYYKNSQNSGAAITRNAALRIAKGRWIAFLDSDDLWLPTKLEKQIKFMEENGYAFSYHEYCEINEESQETGVGISGPKIVTKLGMVNYCWPGCLTVMYDALVVGLVQIANIKKNNDYAMWLKVIKMTDCYLLPESLAKYRKHTGSISNHRYTVLIKWHYRIFREAENMGVVLSIVNTIRNIFFGVVKKVLYVNNTRK